MKIKFLKDCAYLQNEKSQSREYKAGEVYEVSEDHGRRWLRRGFAVEVVAEPHEAKAESLVPGPPRKGHGKAEAL